MKIVVVGGTGLIGAKVVNELRAMGQAVVAAAPSTGVDTVTQKGLQAALVGAHVVIDVSGPSAVGGEEDFFVTSTRHLLAAELDAGVRHHIVLSIVGVDRVDTSDYFLAKFAQENEVRRARVPYSILRSTQFFEFARLIADWNTVDDTIRLPPIEVRPIASDDVVGALVSIARGAPTHQIREVAGPERLPLDDFVRRVLLHHHDERYVVREPDVRPVGFNIEGTLLAPGPEAILTETTLAMWLDGVAAVDEAHGRHAAPSIFGDEGN
jgi:uncharacterized protein YbjT (DUF2867 family)